MALNARSFEYDAARSLGAAALPSVPGTRSPMQDRVKSSLVALRRILRATEGSARSLARETGLTTPQLMVLDHLAERAEATPKTIAQAVGVAQATATALIEKLEARGFVRRRRGETDRRQFWLSLTPEGRAALDAAPDPLQSRFAEKFDRLADWEQSMLVASLERVAALMEAADEAGSGDVAPLLHAGDVAEPHPDPRERRSRN